MTRELKLHLGCGSTVVPGWENIDRSPNVLLSRVPGARAVLARLGILTSEQADANFPRGIVHADVRRRIPYPERSARYVYSSHMIEHMVRRDALAVIEESLRVLVPGGILRVATPDLAALADGYRSGYAWEGMTPADTFMHSFGSSTLPASPLRRLAHQLLTQPHQWLYDAESLTRLFADGGFVDVRERAYRESAIPEIAEIEDRSQSVFVEAARP